MRHTLKTWPTPFQKIWDGEKTFEMRKNDRDFQVGDTLELREYDLEKDFYSGRKILCTVTYILYDFKGLKRGYCILAIQVDLSLIGKRGK